MTKKLVLDVADRLMTQMRSEAEDRGLTLGEFTRNILRRRKTIVKKIDEEEAEKVAEEEGIEPEDETDEDDDEETEDDDVEGEEKANPEDEEEEEPEEDE